MKRTCAILVFATMCLAVSVQATEHPNVIYILADDLGYGDLSCYGQTHFETPNIDALAKQGMKFTRHYSGSTVCAPSRCALAASTLATPACGRGALAPSVGPLWRAQGGQHGRARL